MLQICGSFVLMHFGSLERSADNTERHIGDEIEQNDSQLEYRHAGVVNDIKLLSRQLKPTAMKSLREIARPG